MAVSGPARDTGPGPDFSGVAVPGMVNSAGSAHPRRTSPMRLVVRRLLPVALLAVVLPPLIVHAEEKAGKELSKQVTDRTTGMKLVLIKAGKFKMGSPTTEF